MKAWAFVAIAALIAGNAAADARDVKYGPPPRWIAPPPTATSATTPGGAAARVVYADREDRVSTAGQETYTAYRVKLLAPEALGLGNIVAAWNPSTDELTVHELHIIRDGQVIDVLAGSKFRVIEREDNLAYAMLDGNLTATLQTPGLQVGDELEFAATIRRSNHTFAGKQSSIMMIPATSSPGAYRLRLLWPNGAPLRWQATPDVGKLTVQDRGDEKELDYELRDPDSVTVADGAPARYNLRRLIEYSQFTSWNDLATLMAPLFDKASTLAPNSPVRQEAAKIAASTSDPVARTEAALRLVEDQIRYVFVGLDGGDYLPASADVTWSRRFGDCKAKAVLLAALLRELGISSEIVLVNTNGGDGSNERLPSASLFDHVVVRATIGSKRYWLDATRLGDRRLQALPGPVFRWDLPLRQDGDLEATPISPPVLALASTVMDIDATAGFDKPAKVKIEEVLRSNEATALERALSNLAGHDAQEGLRKFWRQTNSDVQTDAMGWRYDFLQNALILTVSGDMRLDWQGDDQNGRSLSVPGAGFTPPDELRRPKDQDQTAPWTLEFPRFRHWTTIVRLPRATGKWRWDYSDAPVNKRLGGVTYWRQAEFKNGILRSTMSSRTVVPELTSTQAAQLNDGLSDFDNAVSTVFETTTPAKDHLRAGYAPTDAEARAIADTAALRRMQAAALLKAGQPDQALDVIAQAVALDPEGAANFATRAEVLNRLGRREEALNDLDEAWRLNPLDPAIASARAEAMRGLVRTQEVGAPYDPWSPGAPAQKPKPPGG